MIPKKALQCIFHTLVHILIKKGMFENKKVYSGTAGSHK